MSWGYGQAPDLICRTFDYATCKKLWDNTKHHNGRVNLHTGRPSNSQYWLQPLLETHPITKQRMSCYAMMLYNTYIHHWFEDGSYLSHYWDSSLTRDVLSKYGPSGARMWRDSKCRFSDKDRVGPGWREQSYPYGSGIFVTAERVMLRHDGKPMYDERRIIDPTKKKERNEIRKLFRDRTMPRVMLGEFGDIWVRQGEKRLPFRSNDKMVQGWIAQVPSGYTHTRIAEMFYREDPHEMIARALENSRMTEGRVCANREAALHAVIEGMLNTILSDRRWYTTEKIPYGPVQL